MSTNNDRQSGYPSLPVHRRLATTKTASPTGKRPMLGQVAHTARSWDGGIVQSPGQGQGAGAHSHSQSTIPTVFLPRSAGSTSRLAATGRQGEGAGSPYPQLLVPASPNVGAKRLQGNYSSNPPGARGLDSPKDLMTFLAETRAEVANMIPQEITYMPVEAHRLDFEKLASREATLPSQKTSLTSVVLIQPTEKSLAEMVRNESSEGRAEARSQEGLSPLGIIPTTSSSLTPAISDLTGASAYSEKPSKSFFKRPLRMKKDRKGPPPPLITHHPAMKPGPIDALSPVIASPGLGAFSQAIPPLASARVVPSGTNLGAWIKPHSSKTKNNPLLTAAARSILTGDFKLFESFQAAKNRGARASEAAQLSTHPKPTAPPTIVAPTTPKAMKRKPVPAYDLNESFRAPLPPERLIRTTSDGRHRVICPETADSKRSRTTSLPYGPLSPAMEAFGLGNQPSHPEMRLNNLDSPIPKEETSTVFTNTRVPTFGLSPTLPSQYEADKTGGGSYTDSHRRPSLICYEDFRELVTKSMGMPLAQNPESGLSILEATRARASSLSTSRASAVSARGEEFPDLIQSSGQKQTRSPNRGILFERSPELLEVSDRRHSYHMSHISPLHSPLEKITDPMSLIDSISNHHHKKSGSQVARRPMSANNVSSDGKMVRPRRASAPFKSYTLCAPPPADQIMFGFRGEVYDADPEPTNGASLLNLTDDCSRTTESVAAFRPTINRRESSSLQNVRRMTVVVEDSDEEARGAVRINEPDEGSPGQSIRPKQTPPTTAGSLLDPTLSDELKSDYGAVHIELKEISLIENKNQLGTSLSSGGNTNHPTATRRGSNVSLADWAWGSNQPLNQTNIESHQRSIFEDLNCPRGPAEPSSHESSFFDTTRLEDSLGFGLGASSNMISAETSLETAASILGRPVPEVSREIWRSFVKLQIQLEERKLAKLEAEENQLMLGRVTSSVPKKPLKVNLVEVAVQTEPFEGTFSSDLESFLAFDQQSGKTNTAGFHREPDTSEPSNGIKIFTQVDRKLIARRDLEKPQNILRQSCQSEQSSNSGSRVSSGSLRGGASSGETCEVLAEEQLEGRMRKVTRSDRGISRVSMITGKRLSEMSEYTRESHSHQSTARSSIAHHHPIHSVYFPITQLREAILLDPQCSLLNQNPGSPPPILAEKILQALDCALSAEEAFQREKNHLQAVARRQSQTIEGLLVDKEVLTLEVARLTGLVELLARDHNVLNERIDKAEEAYDSMYSSNHINQSFSNMPSPTGTARYFSASGELSLRESRLRHALERSSRNSWSESNLSKGLPNLHANLYDSSGEDGEGEDSEGEEGEDTESLCDPAQSSLGSRQNSFPDHFQGLNEYRKPRESEKPRAKPSRLTSGSPIPGSYPILGSDYFN